MKLLDNLTSAAVAGEYYRSMGLKRQEAKGWMMGFLVGFPLFIVAPCAIATWLGSRVRSPLVAFALTWIATPFVSYFLTVVLAPVLRALIPAHNDGTGVIMIPYYGIATGFIAGIVAAVIVRRRGGRAVPKPNASDQHGTELSGGN